ncbi:MAG: hypothetical protein CBD27_05435 [Rhodospirillaceae bacterium TMED167]|nr:hypothetical protein [Rhodospirillaceae bacterium]OUW27801.1 MAG: hypothetical protein CBD27_05435 [Rhodospirillaceae bacterium TMED167]
MPDNDVLILCESGDGQADVGNNRLIATGAKLADQWGGRLVCLLAGGAADETAPLIAPHVDAVHVADFAGGDHNSIAHAHAAQALVDELNPAAILLAQTFLGMDLAPRIAGRLGVRAASNCLSITPAGDGVTLTRPVQRGRMIATVEVDVRPLVATLQPGTEDLGAGTRNGEGKTFPVPADIDAKVRPLRTIAPEETGVDLAKEEIIVAGGRGVGEKENFALIQDLAAALGGEFGCSRPLVDMDWFDTDRQVGLSGNSVKPKLYVACGISGAREHLHGMKESEVIVAINQDAEAPIFEVAHYGIVGDVNEILPALIERAKRT